MATLVKKQKSLIAIIAAFVACVVIGTTCFISSAFADNADTSDAQTASTQAKLVATYNNDGTITVPQSTLKNDTDKIVVVNKVSITSGYDFVKDWTSDAEGKTIKPGESLTVTWTAPSSVPDDFNGESEVYVGTITYDYSLKESLPDDMELDLSGLSENAYTYDGTAKEPKVKDLVENVDYTIEYKNNINAGTATAIITGIGKYTGTKELTFKINPKEVGIEWQEPFTFTYDGQTHAPEAKLTGVINGDDVAPKIIGGKSQVGENWEAKVETLSGDSRDNYTLPENALTHTFSITQLDITNNEDLTVETGELTYNGKDQDVTYKVMLKGVELTEGVDYQVLSGETSATNVKTDGNYTFTIEGIGNCTGTKDITWNINQLDISEA